VTRSAAPSSVPAPAIPRSGRDRYSPSVSDLVLSIVVFPAAFLAFILAALTWERRHASGTARALTVLLLSLGVWDFAYGLRTAYVPAPDPHLWMSLMYVGVATAPTALLVFAIHFAHLERWLTPPVRAALLVEPVLVIAAAWTDARFGLLFSGEVGLDIRLREHAGPAFWINIAYSYLLLAMSTVILLKHRWSHRHSVYRRQSGIVIFGVVMPWVSTLLLAINATQRDMTPLTVSIAAFAFGYSILRFRMLEVAPIARDLVIERMTDGVLVIDAHGVISDINPMARTLLAISDVDPVGKHCSDCLRHQPKLSEMLRTPSAGRAEIQQSHDGLQYIHATISLLEDHSHRTIGALAIIRDISDRKRLETELQRRAGVDPLTGIGNRRTFDEAADKELRRRNRTGRPLAIALIDVDYLKQVNDRSGHRAGDLALQFLAQVMKRSARTVDVPARIGGDEFALLLPDTSADDAVAAVERIRRDLRHLTDADERIRTVSISVGIASATADTDSRDDIIRLADAALYEAKAEGRDRIRVADQRPRAAQ